MRRTQLLAGGLVLALAVACGGGGSKAPTTKDSLAVLSAAQSKTTAAKSAKVTMKVAAEAAGQTTNLSGDGAFDFAKKLGQMHMSLPRPGGADIAIDVVYSGTSFFMGSDVFQAVAGKHWLKIDLNTFTGDASKFGAQDPTQGLEFLSGASDAKVVGTETVHGEKTTHYTATIDLDGAMAKVQGLQKKLFDRYRALLGKSTMPVDVWIDDSGRVARQVMTTSVTVSGTPATSTVTVEYYDWGTTVTAPLPPASEVGDGNALLSRLTG